MPARRHRRRRPAPAQRRCRWAQRPPPSGRCGCAAGQTVPRSSPSRTDRCDCPPPVPIWRGCRGGTPDESRAAGRDRPSPSQRYGFPRRASRRGRHRGAGCAGRARSTPAGLLPPPVAGRRPGPKMSPGNRHRAPPASPGWNRSCRTAAPAASRPAWRGALRSRSAALPHRVRAPRHPAGNRAAAMAGQRHRR